MINVKMIKDSRDQLFQEKSRQDNKHKVNSSFERISNQKIS